MRIVVALEHSTCRQHSCTNLPVTGRSQACHRTAHVVTVMPQDPGVAKLMRCDPRLGSTRQAKHCRRDGAGHWSRSADRTQRLGPRQHEPSANALLPDRTRPSQPRPDVSPPRIPSTSTGATHNVHSMAAPRLPASISPPPTFAPHDSRLRASMPSPPPYNPRKRQRAEPAQLEKASQPIAKRQRAERDSGRRASAAYWENVSKVWLTKRALEELDRRTLSACPAPTRRSQRSHRSVRRRAHRPATETCAAESGAARRSAQYTVDPLSGCSARTARRIKSAARRGGPDLSELRNVRVATYWLVLGPD